MTYEFFNVQIIHHQKLNQINLINLINHSIIPK